VERMEVAGRKEAGIKRGRVSAVRVFFLLLFSCVWGARGQGRGGTSLLRTRYMARPSFFARCLGSPVFSGAMKVDFKVTQENPHPET
jgi:hypothetical protein